MKLCLLSAVTGAAVAIAAPGFADTVYAIDFDSTRLSGSNTSGSIDTEAGFTLP
jgi:hypothetical protein